MKIQITGTVSKEELLQHISNALDALSDAGGESFTEINLYLNPVVAGERTMAVAGKKPIDFVYDDNGDQQIPCLDFKLMTQSELYAVQRISRKSKVGDGKSREGYQRTSSLQFTEDDTAKKKERQKACVAALLAKLNISYDEYFDGCSSTGWIRTQRGMQNYTDKFIPCPVFRITMKVPGTKRGKKVYLYSESARLVFESELGAFTD
ncbi:hypothetical protein [Photobacterium leiognathi]|uniref:hypothetical protein n=1 Tax=Photobacterium leiognathi TaxID=553611 RepID=UPI0029821E96|nr:hypothetical protein [Photobacterium leiognathi]